MKDYLPIIEDLYKKDIIRNKLKELKINCFRSFEKETIINFDFPLTVFIGINGSGKTTALKLLKTLQPHRTPDDYFFETVFDKEIKEEYSFSYTYDNKTVVNIKKKHFGWILTDGYSGFKSNKDVKEYLNNNNFKKPKIALNDIQFKTLIGAFDKNIFFDNSAKSLNREQKNDYAVRTARKIKQSIETNSGKTKKKKKVEEFSKAELEDLNYILGKSYENIKIIEHKYYNGTWGITILFNEGKEYSEANAGSGEFIIANVINKINKTPKKSLLLLDEPELSLHPGAQKRFMQFIFKKIVDKKLQVIISTHSPEIIKKLPNKCIKNFIINSNNKFQIEQNVDSLRAFNNIEYSVDRKNIIVEDILAKNILLHILEEEKYENIFEINYYPGGAESIKTLLVTTFSKVDISNRYIIFDGDKYMKDVVDFSEVLETNKTFKFYKRELKEVTNVNYSTIKWGVDGNRGKSNKTQKIALIKKYLNFYRSNVFFLPGEIPEDIIFDIEYVKQVFSHLDLSMLDDINNSKEKFHKISELSGMKIKDLYGLFISYFVKEKKNTYKYKRIKLNLDKILGKEVALL
jgi:predicted ATPase